MSEPPWEAEARRWKDTALTIQTNLAATHEREKREEWLRGHSEAFEDAATAYEGTIDSLRLRVAELEGAIRSHLAVEDSPFAPDGRTLIDASTFAGHHRASLMALRTALEKP